MNRRDFVAAGAAVTASLAASSLLTSIAAGPVAAPAGTDRVPLYKVIFDTRFEDSRAFADAAQRMGERVHGIEGDVTALWFEELKPRWARGEGPIAGMNTLSSLFCLEQVAWNDWLRVVARAEHLPQPGGGLRHRVTAAGGTLAAGCAALASGRDWARRIAPPLLACRKADDAVRMQRTVAGVPRMSAASDLEPLVSWVIAA
jgi:hypothetical protein